MTRVVWNNNIHVWEACENGRVYAISPTYRGAVSRHDDGRDIGLSWPERVARAAKQVKEKLGKAVYKGRLEEAKYIACAVRWEISGDMFIVVGHDGVYKVINGKCSCPDRVDWCKHNLAFEVVKVAKELR